MSTERLTRGAMAAGAAFFLGAGAWAFLAPSSFYEHIASFPPYNRHFVHDLGAFQVGLGTALLLGWTRWPGRLIALWGVAAASVLHGVSHFLDRDLGGRSSDPALLSLIGAAFLAVALLATSKELRLNAPSRPTSGLRPPASQGAPQQD